MDNENEVYELVRVRSREIVVSSDIDSPLCTELCMALREIEEKTLAVATEYNSTSIPPIILRLQTWGGDLHPSFAVIDLIKALRVPLIVEINGYCASAGTLISSACETVVMNPRAFILVHQLSSAASGTRSEIIDHGRMIDSAHGVVIDLYKEKTGLAKKRIKKILARESWMTAKEAHELGFVDEIGVV